MRYLSTRTILAGLTVAPAAVANATINWPIGRSMTVSGQIRNLFNALYADPASDEHVPDSIEQNGRTLRFGLRWSLSGIPIDLRARDSECDGGHRTAIVLSGVPDATQSVLAPGLRARVMTRLMVSTRNSCSSSGSAYPAPPS